jgi:hypothetical protein
MRRCLFLCSVKNLSRVHGSSIQAVEIDSLEGAYYLVSSISHHLDIPIPQKPFFGAKVALPLVTQNPDEENKRRAPYMRFMFNLGIDIPDQGFKDFRSKLASS